MCHSISADPACQASYHDQWQSEGILPRKHSPVPLESRIAVHQDLDWRGHNALHRLRIFQTNHNCTSSRNAQYHRHVTLIAATLTASKPCAEIGAYRIMIS